MFRHLKIMQQGLLLVTVLLLFEFTFILIIKKFADSVDESLREERHAKEMIQHIQKLRNFEETAAISLARYKSSDSAQDIGNYKSAEYSIVHEIKLLKDEVKGNPTELQRVERLEYMTNKAQELSVEYREKLAMGDTFGQVNTLLKLAKIGEKVQPDIAQLLEPYQAAEKDHYEEGVHRRKLFDQLLYVGVPFSVLFCSISVLLWVTRLSRRVNVIVDNIGRFGRKEKLNPIVAKQKDEVYVVDVRFHEMAKELTEAEKKAKEIEQLKQEFVSMISHDLRSPLTSLQFTLSLVEDGTYGELDPTGTKRVQAAGNSVVRLIGMINDLLDLEKMESGMMKLEKAEFNVEDLFNESVTSVEGMAEQAKVKIESKPTDTVIDGDYKRLAQVVVNLLSNAIKFSPEGSKVSLIAENVDGFSRICVIDRGRGVPREFQDSIFERFKQVKDSDGQPKKGTGLGLAIAKSIVELHGGEIGLKSEEGTGSMFWFSVPRIVDDEE